MRRVVVLVGLLVLLGPLMAGCSQEKDKLLYNVCSLLTADEVKDAFGVAVERKEVSDYDEVDSTVPEARVCRWTAGDDVIVEMQTAGTLDVFAAYGSSDASSYSTVAGRDEPVVLDRLVFVPPGGEGLTSGGGGQTVLIADRGRSLGLQCKRPPGGERLPSGRCLKLAEQAMGQVMDDSISPDGDVAPESTCGLLTAKEVQDLTGISTIIPDGVSEPSFGGRSGVEIYECQWVLGSVPLVTVQVGLRLASQCAIEKARTAIGSGATGTMGTNPSTYEYADVEGARLGAAKGEYCLHVNVQTRQILANGGDVTATEAKELYEKALERLDGR